MANPDLRIADILLRIETLAGLVTKGALLTNSETDKNFIAIYNELYILLQQVTGSTFELNEIPINFNDISGNPSFQILSGSNGLQISKYNTTTLAYDLRVGVNTDGDITIGDYARMVTTGNALTVETYDAVNTVWEPVSVVNLPDLINKVNAGVIKYGFLYNWYAVDNASVLSSGDNGYDVPANTDFATLSTYLGGDTVSGGKLKETGFLHWDTPNTGATNEVGFGARGGGVRDLNGTYAVIKVAGYFWTSTNYDATTSYCYTTFNNDIIINNGIDLKKDGMSLRLFRAATAPEQLYTDGQIIPNDYTGNNGRVYNGVKIGTQIWLTENLIETKYADGSPIAHITDATDWAADTTGAYCSYDNDISNAITRINTGTTSVRSITAATHDIIASDQILNVTYTTTAAVTSLTLTTAECYAGRTLTIKDAGGNALTNNITIDTENGETIDGAATKVINTDYGFTKLYADGSNWFTIA